MADEREEERQETPIEASKRRLEERRKARAKLIEAQEAIDYEALERAADEHGIDGVARLRLARFVEGLPTFAIVRAADRDLSKVHRDRITKAKRGRDGQPDTGAAIRAAAEVGKACIVYPDAEGCAAIREHFEDLYIRAGTVALDMARTHAEEEGKD